MNLNKYGTQFFFGIIFLFLILRSYFLVYPDANLYYAFMRSDSYDWIANGLYYAGYNVNFSLRPPGLPILIMLLEKMKMLNFLPVINQLVLFGFLVALYKILRINWRKITSFITISLVFLNYFVNNYSLYILADLFACFFITVGFYFYFKAIENKNFYIWSSFFLVISFFFQYAIIFSVPIIIIDFLRHRRFDINDKYFRRALFIGLFAIGSYLVYKKIVYGSFLYSKIGYFHMLSLHFDSIFFYFINIVSVLSIFGFLIFSLGLLLFLFHKKIPWHESNIQINHFLETNFLLAIGWFIFWVLIYNWNDKRFVIYLIPFIIPFLGLAVDVLLRVILKDRFLRKTLAITILALAFFGSQLYYRSFSVADLIKINNVIALQFELINNKKNSSNINLRLSAPKIIKDSKGFSPNNLDVLAAQKKASFSSYKKNLEYLDEIKSNYEIQNDNAICTEYGNVKEYSMGNKFGNFFKKRLLSYPNNCDRPIIKINDKGWIEKY